MKLLFVADGRSPTALNWIGYFVKRGDEVHLVSSFPCPSPEGLTSFQVIPLGLSQAQGEGSLAGRTSLLRRLLPVSLRTFLRQRLAPLTLSRAAARLRIAINELKPDLIHAMRIPYEGMLVAEACQPGSCGKIPLLISVWGNDFTLHAEATPWMSSHTRHTLVQADALHTDCRRDQNLAREWGFLESKPRIVLPGGGGIRMQLFHPGMTSVVERQPVVINPRGFRAYVRNDTFFQMIPLVLAGLPEARFLCPTMQGEPQAHKWITQYGIGSAIELLPFQNPQQMADLYRRSRVVVSLTMHDGTPNTLLEALACGCFPVVGDLESLREWVCHGENGLLVNPADPQAVADALLTALSDPSLCLRAAERNVNMILQRAVYGQVMQQAREFYNSLIS